MNNPVYQILEKQKPFTYFHTHVIDAQILKAAIDLHKSLEVDVSIDEDGTIYVGHPLTYYTSRNMPRPTNVPLETIIKESSNSDLYLIFDLKNVKVIPKVKEMIELYGAERCLIHAFAKELSFKPWPPKVVAQSEESWEDEELPLAKLIELKQTTGAPMVLSCHGITLDRLKTEEASILEQVFAITKQGAEAINFFLPKDELMPMPIMQKLIQNKVIPLVNIDRTPLELRPQVYLGTTDILERASTNF